MQPGDSGRIPLKIRTGNLDHKLSKSITVYTNIPDSRSSAVKISLSGEVWQPLQVTPKFANFGKISRATLAKGGQAKKLLIVNKLGAEAAFGEVKSNNPLFGATINVIESGKRFELVVNLLPIEEGSAASKKLRKGTNTGEIVISTGMAEMPTLKVRTNAHIMADVEVTPSRLQMPAKQASRVTRSIYVRNNTKTPLEISDLVCSNPELKVKLREQGKGGKTFQISVEIPPNYQPRGASDRITFKTNCPTVPTVIVPILKGRTTPRRTLTAGAAKPRPVPGRVGRSAGGIAPVGAAAGPNVGTDAARTVAPRPPGAKSKGAAPGAADSGPVKQ